MGLSLLTLQLEVGTRATRSNPIPTSGQLLILSLWANSLRAKTYLGAKTTQINPFIMSMLCSAKPRTTLSNLKVTIKAWVTKSTTN